jgi:cell division septation protein DedD
MTLICSDRKQKYLDTRAFIRELLFEHDCVIVPGFGGFVGNFSPARIDKIAGTFFPPLKKISFNRNLNHNDGLLISRISRSTGLNYGDTRHLVEEFVMELKGRLARGEKVIFDHIGKFAYNRENNIEFEPEANINYYAGSFGLESFQCVPVGDYDVRKRITRHSDKDPLKQTSVRRYLWRAAVVIPILALLIAVPLKTDLFKTKVETTTLNPLVTAEFENNKKAVDEAVIIVPDSNTSVKPETSETAVPETKETVKPETPPESKPVASVITNEGNYCIITGSFKSEENALSLVKSLKSDGFDPEINQGPNGFFRVTAAVCPTLGKAISVRDSISKKFPGTWISKR